MRLPILIVLSIMAMLISGCSQIHTLISPIHVEAVSPSDHPGPRAELAPEDFRAMLKAKPARAVLLPFADYSPYDSPLAHSACHDSLRKALKEAFGRVDLEIAGTKEDVAGYLLRKSVILDALPILQEESPRAALLVQELEDEWSEEMQIEIGKTFHESLMKVYDEKRGPESSPLDRRAIRATGKAFESEYVIRGRITVFQPLHKWEPSPRPRERLAFYFAGPNQRDLRVGLATLSAYEHLDGDMPPPPEASASPEKKQPFEEENQKITPLVRMDLFVQDACSGEVIYSRPVEVRSAQILSLSPQQGPDRYELMNRALDKAARALIQPLLP